MPKVIKNKKSKVKQRRRRFALMMIFFLILSCWYLLTRAKNYEKTYQINEFTIVERFQKDVNAYRYEIKKENYTWHFVIKHKYINQKKLIQNIEIMENENTICIIPKSEQFSTYPQCIEENKPIDYHLVNHQMKEMLSEQYFIKNETQTDLYEKINIKNMDQNTYYIWNYKGFYKINKNSKENIVLFDKDIYNISNVAQVNHYLLIPDYQASFFFNKFYIINMDDGSKTTWEFKDSIYFDGYYLGSYDQSLFYVDRKTKIEWEIVPKKKKMRKVGTEKKDGKIWAEEEWKKLSLTKLTNDTLKFEYPNIYHYEIEKGLYVRYDGCESRKKISNQDVKEIVQEIGEKVYYLVGESLFYYSEETGEVEVMSNFEWNFNYKNMIFIKE